MLFVFHKHRGVACTQLYGWLTTKGPQRSTKGALTSASPGLVSLHMFMPSKLSFPSSVLLFFLPWSTHAYATHTYSFQTLRNLIIFIHLDALPYTCHHYRQKTVISIVTNLRTALIVTTRTIILMGLFVPPERNVHHNRWIGDDTVRTITRAIAILNQRSVKHDSSLQEKKKKLKIAVHTHNNNNRTGSRVLL